MPDVAERFVPVDGCHNVRDVGGYATHDGRTVRWGRLYRADGPNQLTPDGRAAVDALGITTVIDLRSEAEHGTQAFHPEAISLPMADVPGTNWTSAVLSSTDDLARRYYDMAAAGGRTVATSFDLLANRLDRPALVHCAAGKDRTGILVALVLGVLGVPDDVIADDYGLSHEPSKRRRTFMQDVDPDLVARYGELAPVVLTAQPATMAAFLVLVRGDHGAMADFVGSLGVSRDAIDQIRTHLLA